MEYWEASSLELGENLTKQILQLKKVLQPDSTSSSADVLSEPLLDLGQRLEVIEKCWNQWTEQGGDTANTESNSEAGWHPIHLAALVPSGDFVNKIIKADPGGTVVNQKYCPDSNIMLTPLMCAALGGYVPIMDALLQGGACFSECPLKELVIYAIIGNGTNCFRRVTNYVTGALGVGGGLISPPINILEMFEAQILLEDISKNLLRALIRFRNKFDSQEPYIHVDLAQLLFCFVRKGYSKLVQVVLKRAPEFSQASPTSSSFIKIADLQDEHGRSLVHLAVISQATDERAAEMIQVLLRNNPDLKIKDMHGKTAFNYAVDAGFEECCNMLLLADTYISSEDIESLEKSINNFYFKHLTNQIRFSKENPGHVEIELRTLKTLCKARTPKTGTRYFLKYIVEEARKDLLEHEVVDVYLHLRWQYFKKFFIGSIISYFLQLTFYTMFVASVLTVDQSKVEGNRRTLMVIGFAGSLSIFILRGLYFLVKSWCLDMIVGEGRYLVETIPMLAMVTFSFTRFPPPEDNSLYVAILRSVNALAVFLAHANTLWFFSTHPELGIYVEMLSEVFRNFAKFFATYIFLLVGFAMAFSVMLIGEPPFEDIPSSFLQVLIMMAGNVDEDGEDGKKFGVGAKICQGAFILTITLFLVNLLIGLAVDDIKELRAKSKVRKTIRLIEYMNAVEGVLYKGKTLLPEWLRKTVRKHIKIPLYPGPVEFNPHRMDRTPIPRELMQKALITARAQKKNRVNKRKLT